MLEKLKEFGWGGLGIVFMLLMISAFVFLIKGGVWLTENYLDLFSTVNGWVFGVILILLVLSLIPKARFLTGIGIYYGTFIWGVLFWLFCLFVTYEFWGFIGVFFGLVFFGVGVFVTAALALTFDGQIWAAGYLLLNLLFIYGVRKLGYWIATKYPFEEIEVMPIEDNQTGTE